jgi:hypothetical protein
MIFGEFDDSPGLQGLGLILIISVVFLYFRHHRSKWPVVLLKFLYWKDRFVEWNSGPRQQLHWR